MPQVQGPVSANGDIIVPAKSGVVIPISQKDSSGNLVDISSTPMRLYVRGRIDKMLSTDPNNPQGKLLIITETEANKLSSTAIPFSVLSLNNPEVPQPVWVGKISRSLQ